MTGVIVYWNGLSGWITPDDVADVCTGKARDILLKKDNIISGNPVRGSSVSYEIDSAWDGLAREVSVL